MGKIFFCLLVCFSIIPSLQAQDAEIISRDSLEGLTRQVAEDLKAYKYHTGIEGAMNLLKAAKKAENDYYHYHAHNFLGNAYIDLKDTVRAKKNYEYALKYAERIENDTLVIWANNNLGNIYSEYYDHPQKGIEIYKKVISLSEAVNLPNESLTPKINIAWTYLDYIKPYQAFPYLKDARKMITPDEESYVKAPFYMLMGRYFKQTAKPDSAEVYFKKSIKLAEEDSLLLPASEVIKDYADLLYQQDRFEEAYQYLQKRNEYEALLYENEKLEQVQAANARFDVNEYQKNLELAEQEKEFQEQIIDKSQEKVVVMVISSLVLMFILFFLNKINQDRKALIDELRVKNRELQQAKERAERLSMLKTQFFSTVSHELRTPLYGVVGLTSLLLEEEDLQNHRNDLNSLKFSADYLLALINDVLQMNKMDADLVKLESVDFKLEELILSIVNSFEFTRLQNKNKIHFEIDENIPEYLKGDPVRLSQILMNLVGNAMKFTERGNINISAWLAEAEEETACVHFEVKDDGIGIPKSKQKLIFEEFSQLRSSNYNYQGTGLGLPIVKKLLHLFGSKIYLESDEGKGAVFNFRIKFELGSEDGQKSFELPRIYRDIGENKNVLIVDDNRINQVVTSRILKKKEFNCKTASNGEEAIQKVRDEKFHLILMDVNMPGISGLEATQRIREFNTEVPIIALTAVEIEEIRNKIYASGMNDIIIKPYDVQQFYQIVYRNLKPDLVNKVD